MPARIFPSTAQELGSEREINTIDWSNFAVRIAEVQEAGDKDKLTPEMLEQIKAFAARNEDEDEEIEDEDGEDEGDDAPSGTPEHLKKFVFKSKGKDTDSEADMVKKGGEKTASNQKRVIEFTHASQISTEALEAARVAGDTQLEKAILAARHDCRVAVAQKLDTLAEAEAKKSERQAKRHNYRMSLVKTAEAAEKRIAEAKKAEAQGEGGFKTVSAMNATEKQVAASRLLAQGFPQVYVDAMLGLNVRAASVELTETEKQLRDVMASELPESTKRTAVAALVKVAELSEEQIARQIRYWKEELGYGDAEWIKDLFSAKHQD